MTPSLEIERDQDALAVRIAGTLALFLRTEQAMGRTPSVVLTGGTIAGVVYRAVVTHPVATHVDWSQVDFWWGDERWVPTGHDDRNDVLAAQHLLDPLGVPAHRRHPMPADDGEHDVTTAAAAYARTVPEQPFDVVLLGMGPDGHVASLFPDHPDALRTDAAAIDVHHSPKPPPTRISLTFPVLQRARSVWFLVSGEGKADAVASAVAGHDLPAGRVQGAESTLWWLDDAAASRLPR